MCSHHRDMGVLALLTSVLTSLNLHDQIFEIWLPMINNLMSKMCCGFTLLNHVVCIAGTSTMSPGCAEREFFNFSTTSFSVGSSSTTGSMGEFSARAMRRFRFLSWKPMANGWDTKTWEKYEIIGTYMPTLQEIREWDFFFGLTLGHRFPWQESTVFVGWKENGKTCDGQNSLFHGKVSLAMDMT